MALANQEKHLLLSTGNKSELAVGYCTLYGDMNGGLSVSGDLYKTNVFKFCNWLDSEDSINHRKSYILDNILKGIIEEKKDLQQLEEDGYKKDLILKIISLIKKAEFKRKQAPPILKLSSQSLGSDWRIPIAISY